MSYSGFNAVRSALFGALFFSPIPGFAATDLGVPWPSLTIELNIAAARVGGEPLASNGTCDQGRTDPCRWSAPGHIDFETESDGSGNLRRIEAGWSGDDDPSGGTAFRRACAAIVSLVEPRWSRAQVSAALAKTMVITDVRGSAPERRRTIGGVSLFGDRNARSEPSRPGAAFLQCGALPAD